MNTLRLQQPSHKIWWQNVSLIFSGQGPYDIYDEGKTSRVTISDSSFIRNVAGPPLPIPDGPPTVATEHGWGGAIFLGSSSLVQDDNSFITARGRLIVKIGPRVQFLENTATRGAAIASVSITTLSVESAEFVRNVGLEGAAMFVQTDGDHQPRVHVDPLQYTEVSLSTFHGNIASSGGALFLRASLAPAPLRRAGISPKGISRVTPTGLNNNEDDVFFEHCSFTDNMCVVSGGAVYSEAGRVGCKDCVFDGNGVVESNDAGCGGALALTQQAALHGRNVTFTNNAAAFGGAVHAAKSLVDLIDADVASNTATVDGGGLSIEVPSTTIFKHNVVGRVANSTVQGNKAKNGGGRDGWMWTTSLSFRLLNSVALMLCSRLYAATQQHRDVGVRFDWHLTQSVQCICCKQDVPPVH